MRLFGSERIMGLVDRLGMPEDQPIDATILSGSIESAQKRLEAQNFNRRKSVLDYDNVMNEQRKIIYAERLEVLNGGDLKSKIERMIRGTIIDAVDLHIPSDDKSMWALEELKQKYLGLLCAENDFTDTTTLSKANILSTLTERAMAIWHQKDVLFGEEVARELERKILLQNVDRQWMEHLEDMEDLRGSVGLQAYAQRNPVNQYRIAGADIFDEMIVDIRNDTVRMLLSAMPKPQTSVKRVQVIRPMSEGHMNFGVRKPTSIPHKPASANMPVRSIKKPERNDPCPCGSGKKYKKCCGANKEE
jgi:preprotein translocase subunit SecA